MSSMFSFLQEAPSVTDHTVEPWSSARPRPRRARLRLQTRRSSPEPRPEPIPLRLHLAQPIEPTSQSNGVCTAAYPNAHAVKTVPRRPATPSRSRGHCPQPMRCPAQRSTPHRSTARPSVCFASTADATAPRHTHRPTRGERTPAYSSSNELSHCARSTQHCHGATVQSLQCQRGWLPGFPP